MDENKVEAPTLIKMLSQNRNLINECLEIVSSMYADFTSDAIPSQSTNEPSCIMGDIVIQNQSLRNLLDGLLAIRSQIK